MAWCHQTTSHYLNQSWPSSVMPYDIARPQQVCHGQGKVREIPVFLRVREISGNFVICYQSQGKLRYFCLWSLSMHIFSCDQAALQMVFSVCPSVRPSVCPSVRLSVTHFDYVPIIVSSRNFQELLPMTNVRSMQKVKVRGQRSRSQRSQPNLTVSGL